MTDNEIIKALECCANKRASCKDCPAFVAVDRSNCRAVFTGAIDLINRQKAEIERLKQAVVYDVNNFASEYDSKIKAEAVTEFAKLCVDRAQDGAVPVCDLPDIVAEFLGGDA